MTSPIPSRRHDTWFRDRAPMWKRGIASGVAMVNRWLDALGPLRLAYSAQLFAGLEWSEIELPVTAEAHAGLDGLRAVFLSDLHAGSYLSERDLDRLFGLVAERAPDLVLFGGDMVHTRRRELGMYERPLRRLVEVADVYAVPGNHERFRGLSIEEWRDRMEEWGVHTLCNRGVRVERGGSSLWLCGVDDLTEGTPDLAAALSGRRRGEPALMLSHHPDLFDAIAEHGVELTLAGHTHGGQIVPFGVVPVRHSDRGYHRGTFERGSSRLHVGRGIGAAILPLRLGARPEVPVVTVRRRPADPT